MNRTILPPINSALPSTRARSSSVAAVWVVEDMPVSFVPLVVHRIRDGDPRKPADGSRRWLTGLPPRLARVWLIPPDQQARVMPPEPEAVGHDVIDPDLAGDVGDVVEVAAFVGMVEVDRRREDVVVDGQGRDDQLD